jgi:hypothetical protein
MDIGGQQDETGEKDDEMVAYDEQNHNDYHGIVENIAAVDSEPEEGRERDMNHR